MKQISVTEYMQQNGVSRTTVYRLIRSGAVKADKVDNQWMITTDEKKTAKSKPTVKVKKAVAEAVEKPQTDTTKKDKAKADKKKGGKSASKKNTSKKDAKKADDKSSKKALKNKTEKTKKSTKKDSKKKPKKSKGKKKK